jgi:TPR repeat protein
MLFTAIKVKLAALVVVAGIDTADLKTMSPEMKGILEQLAKDQQDKSKDLNAVMTEAVNKVNELATKGDPDANYALGRWTVTGVLQGAPLDQTIGFYKLAADKGQIPAKSELAQIMLQAYSQDAGKVAEAVELIQQAEAGGDRAARRLLANLHLNGVAKIEKSAEKARDLLMKGSEGGDGEATFMLYQLYSAGVNGSSILKDDKKALEFLKKAAEEQGSPVAMSTLGARLFNGDQPTAGGAALVEKNPEKALEMFTKAADKGNAAANRLLAQIHEEGLGGQKKDAKKALEFYSKAASARDAEALFRMGVASELGWMEPESKEVLVQPNPKNALDLYRLAAQNGDLRALYNVGVYYEAGNVVDKDVEKAFSLFKRAAESGVREAMQKVGLAYQNGQGIQQDLVAAKSWFEMGSNENFAPSQLSLGAMYELGAGVRANPAAAANQYSLAADQGQPLAMLRLASMYERGATTPKNEPDFVKAWNYAKQAVDASNKADVAVKYLEALEKLMSAEQKTQAQKVYDAAKKSADAAAKPAAAK